LGYRSCWCRDANGLLIRPGPAPGRLALRCENDECKRLHMFAIFPGFVNCEFSGMKSFDNQSVTGLIRAKRRIETMRFSASRQRIHAQLRKRLHFLIKRLG